MKKLLLLLTILSITGCSLEELRHEDRSVTSKAFSVEQAREFFEKDYVDRLTKSQDVDTRAGGFRGRIHPGDFTPLWDKSVYSESDGVAAYDVDIIADRKVVAIRSKFGASGSRAERLNVYQKLVVRRDIESGKMSAYVMSIIPDVGCEDRRIPDRFSSRGKDKGAFSGIVVYATTERGTIVRVQEYKGGVKNRGVYIPSGKGSYIDRCVKAREILNGVTLMSKRNILTRSGEDDWSDEYEDWYDEHPIELDPWWVGRFEEVGFGVYTDGEGHYYLDNDGDGLIDEETIAPGYVEDEEPEEPEETETPMPEPGAGDDHEDGNEDGDNIFEDDDENESPNDGDGLHSIGFVAGGDMPDSDVYQITPQDKLARNDMPEMPVNQTQLPATCVFSSMSYISLIFGDDVEPGDIMLKYLLITNDLASIEPGVDPKYLPILMSEYFDYTTVSVNCTHSLVNYSCVTTAVDSGDVLLGVYMTENECLHAIVFIGYNENNKKLIYVDPIDGHPHSLSESDCANLCLIYVVKEKQ